MVDVIYEFLKLEIEVQVFDIMFYTVGLVWICAAWSRLREKL